MHNRPKDAQRQRTLKVLHTFLESERTTGNSWRMSVREFPTGDVEVVALRLGPDDQLKGGGGKRRNTSREEMKEQDLARSVRRARRVVYHRCLTLMPDNLLTLTYRDNQTDLDLGWQHFRRFNQLMQKRYGARWQYVCAPEYQQRGAVHFHLAIRGYYHWNTVRAFWRQAIGGDGNVDFQPRRGKYQTDPSKISGYLAKYISKTQATEFNRRRYSSSKIIIPPPIVTWMACGASAAHVMCEVVRYITRKPVRRVFDFHARFSGIFVTT